MTKKLKKKKVHKSVLLNEVLAAFSIPAPLHSTKKVYIDATLGLGGHSERLINSGGYVLGIDTDQEALKNAVDRLVKACPGDYQPVVTSDATTSGISTSCFELVHDNFSNIQKIAKERGITGVDGILFDLGVNSPQLTSETRGLSFQFPDAPLDMRLDPQNQAVTAADLLNSLREDQLSALFESVVDSYHARKFARAISKYRMHHVFETVGDLLESVKNIHSRSTKTHPATLVFMAIRIAVNSELDILPKALKDALTLLKPEGVLLVISFHSGEDSIVKNTFKQFENEGLASVSRKPIVPSEAELSDNPRARSAKMRIATKIPTK